MVYVGNVGFKTGRIKEMLGLKLKDKKLNLIRKKEFGRC